MLSVPAGDRLPAAGPQPRAAAGAHARRAPRLARGPRRGGAGAVRRRRPALGRPVHRGAAGAVRGATAARRACSAVFTFRPEYDPPWKGKAVQTQVGAQPPDAGQVGEMIRAQAGDATCPQAVVDQIAERTDGVPLFVEEFTRLIAEGGRGRACRRPIPATLQDLLLARLDRMASDHEVVQLGATIGRTFAYDLIRAASDRDEAVLRAELREAGRTPGCCSRRARSPRATYTFKHALIQDAAYQSLVKKTAAAVPPPRSRRRWRRRSPRWSGRSRNCSPTTSPRPARRRRSVGYWLTAGRARPRRSAYPEAIRHLRRGLALLGDAARGGRTATAPSCSSACRSAASYIAVPRVRGPGGGGAHRSRPCAVRAARPGGRRCSTS